MQNPNTDLKMVNRKKLSTLCFVLIISLNVTTALFSQVNENTENKNPFSKFIGEWTLKDDNWSQNWGGGMEHIKIQNHHTAFKSLNTANSILALVDGPPPHGHILWTYNPVKKTVSHLSSFGPIRIGIGEGSVDPNANVSLKISFEGEAEGTYRLYSYNWIDENSYELKSTQYDRDNNPTGFFYGGIFVRISN